MFNFYSLQRKFIRHCSSENQVNHSEYRHWVDSYYSSPDEDEWQELMQEDAAFDYQSLGHGMVTQWQWSCNKDVKLFSHHNFLHTANHFIILHSSLTELMQLIFILVYECCFMIILSYMCIQLMLLHSAH